jgi:CTP:molybdopterin cytidylyltransferase MocA
MRTLPSGETLLARSIRACTGFPTIVVCSPELLASVAPTTAIVNDRPELGMTHSLRLADAVIDASNAIAVLPADLASIAPENVRAVAAAAEGADVTFPRRADGTPGHPVIFSPYARSFVATLADGDSIRTLRDRDGLKRRPLPIDDDWPYRDVDRISDL